MKKLSTTAIAEQLARITKVFIERLKCWDWQVTISIAIGAIVAVIGIICLVELDIPITNEGIGIT
ncbi:MAG: hypothetical protein VW879_12265, partial [Opitutae bacterium]